MKFVYILTCYDSKIDACTFSEPYSNLRSAKGSFDNLTKHIINKHNLVNPEIKKWTFNTGGANRTDIIDSRFNITLVQKSVSKEISTFI